VFSYTALGDTATYKDRNQNLHEYVYDALGREVADVATYPTTSKNIITWSYKSRRPALQDHLLRRLTTIDDNIYNQEENVYNGLGQLTRQYQEHQAVPVDEGSSPHVDYAYTEMAAA